MRTTGAAIPTVPEAPPVLIRSLHKRLGSVPAVDGLDLEVGHGQILGLAGPNGAGKSITLRILLGLVRPDSGRVELFGQPISPGAAVLARVGALVDGPGFVPHLSGLANLRLACRMSGRDLAPEALEEAVEFAGLGPAIDRKYKTYSHGMRYRLGLAQATLGRPDLLLLDEPTTALDPEHTAQVRRVIQAASAQGITVVFSSHELTEVERICTDAVVMRQGRAVLGGRVADLVAEHGSLERAYLAVLDRPGAEGELSGSARAEEHLA